MSVQAISWVIENSQHSGNSFVVLLMIANHARSDGTGAWPSIATIAREARTSERTVHRSIQELEESGELSIAYKEGPSGTNYYDLAKMSLCHKSPDTLPKTAVDPAIAMAPEPSLTVNEPSVLSTQTLNSIQRKAQRKEAKRQAKLAAEREARSGKRIATSSGGLNVQEIPTRSKGEERAERTRKALEVLDHPERLPEHLRPTVPARSGR